MLDVLGKTDDEILEEVMPDALRKLHKNIERKYSITIRRYRMDNQLNLEPTGPYAHHQVGVAERVNRTIREGAGALIHETTLAGQISKIITEEGEEILRESTLPETLWPEAIVLFAGHSDSLKSGSISSMRVKIRWRIRTL